MPICFNFSTGCVTDCTQIMADLENGLWAGNEKAMPQEPIVADYVTAMVKGKTDGCAIDA